MAELDARRAGPGGREGEHVAEEVAAVLAVTGPSATALLELARRLKRLSATRAMLAGCRAAGGMPGGWRDARISR